jgi:hypothetical protein
MKICILLLLLLTGCASVRPAPLSRAPHAPPPEFTPYQDIDDGCISVAADDMAEDGTDNPCLLRSPSKI